MRIGLRGQVRRTWAPRGVKVVQRVEWERKWVYLNIAVNGVSGTMRWEWSEQVTAATLASVLQRWGGTRSQGGGLGSGAGASRAGI